MTYVPDAAWDKWWDGRHKRLSDVISALSARFGGEVHFTAKRVVEGNVIEADVAVPAYWLLNETNMDETLHLRIASDLIRVMEREFERKAERLRMAMVGA